MKDNKDLLYVGKYNVSYNDILDLHLGELEIYRSKGLPTHMVKRKHFKALKYIDYIPDIISEPDYIGVNPNEKDISIEMIKKYSDNILIGIKLDSDGEYLYVSTMHDIQESKISRRLFGGRIKDIKNRTITEDKNDFKDAGNESHIALGEVDKTEGE